MDGTNQEVVGEKCVHNNAGEHALTDEDKMKAWVEHYARLLNIEFEWPSSELPEVPPTAGPSVSTTQCVPHPVCPPPSVSTTQCVRHPVCPPPWSVKHSAKCKAASPSGIVAEMLKAAGIMVSSSQIKSWSSWNGYQTPTSARRWTLTRGSSALCLVKLELTPSSLFTSCRRTTLQLRNYSILPSLTLRKTLMVCQGRSYGGP